MNKICFLIIISAFLSCKNKNNLDFVKTFEGQLESKPLIIKITSNAGNVVGDCKYNGANAISQLKGLIKDEEINLNEFDSTGNQTGIFKGKFENSSKIIGSWSKPNGDKTQNFVLIESTSVFEKPKESIQPSVLSTTKDTNSLGAINSKQNVTSTKEGGSIQVTEIKGKQTKILQRDSKYRLYINSTFIKSASEPIRAILAFYATKASSDCDWENGKASSSLDNLVCQLTTELELGRQCKNQHLGFIRQWFSEEPKVLSKIKDNCYQTPSSASGQLIYDDLTMNWLRVQQLILKLLFLLISPKRLNFQSAAYFKLSLL